MVRIENVLVYDIPPFLALIGTIVTAKVAKQTQGKVTRTQNKVAEVHEKTETIEGQICDNGNLDK